ncbi:hypothetical protein T265_06573 [Opisthorchis viverrini]|uniref:Uncharacterized protein n=1 Tax=Opisthorchis viverrini TaxID=6198 RepID=A0A074ZFW8_OPIVI|nr:hypothetical protein T265_06573 [Opisthorchis viverrini]KER26093.1 hypothetical protein T265_06573 [Opisthorchis viverrini]
MLPEQSGAAALLATSLQAELSETEVTSQEFYAVAPGQIDNDEYAPPSRRLKTQLWCPDIIGDSVEAHSLGATLFSKHVQNEQIPIGSIILLGNPFVNNCRSAPSGPRTGDESNEFSVNAKLRSSTNLSLPNPPTTVFCLPWISAFSGSVNVKRATKSHYSAQDRPTAATKKSYGRIG